MSYTSGTNIRSIKNYSGGRGIVSQMNSRMSGARNNAITSSSFGKNESTTGSSSSMNALRTELKTYSKIATDSAKNLQKNGEKLVAEGENSLFDNAEKTGNTGAVVNKAEDFVNDYNKVMSSIKKLGGAENKKYASEMAAYAETNKEALAKIGITVLKDGSLTMNKDTLKGASLDDLKKVFNGKDSFAGKVTDLSDDIEKNVQEKLEENLKLLGSNNQNRNSGSSGSFFNMYI